MARSLLLVCLLACAAPEAPAPAGPDEGAPADPDHGRDAEADAPRASVTAVRATGSAGAYTFAVTVESDETGCDRYADWWEVLRADGTLAYRRILAHSHVDEQPFTRSGGPVPVADDETVIVRAHLRPAGVDAPGVYRGQVLRGTVRGGFDPWDAPRDFAAALENADPQARGCAF
ncbi:MAG: hypothetical protein AAF447_20390 [Myxococcota bacterium]